MKEASIAWIRGAVWDLETPHKGKFSSNPKYYPYGTNRYYSPINSVPLKGTERSIFYYLAQLKHLSYNALVMLVGREIYWGLKFKKGKAEGEPVGVVISQSPDQPAEVQLLLGGVQCTLCITL